MAMMTRRTERPGKAEQKTSAGRELLHFGLDGIFSDIDLSDSTSVLRDLALPGGLAGLESTSAQRTPSPVSSGGPSAQDSRLVRQRTQLSRLVRPARSVVGLSSRRPVTAQTRGRTQQLAGTLVTLSQATVPRVTHPATSVRPQPFECLRPERA
jgi:hypothetical protein